MSLLIYLISFFEWFTTLSIEIIAIRNFTPIIGSSSISTSIILWVILLALSYWYYIWWKRSKNEDKNFIIKAIIKNLVIASLYYMFFTFIFDEIILNLLLETTSSYFFSILIASFLLFFIPIFLASQTIPLLSVLLKWDNTWEKIWKLLFYSTIGSFLGSVTTSTLLFPTIWVEKTALFNSFILSSIVVILSFKLIKKINIFMIIGIFIFFLSIIGLATKELLAQNILFQKSNAYHNIVIYETNYNQRIFSQNNWFSSGINISTKESFFPYIKEIKTQILENNYENILIIWAAWFTLPYELSDDSIIKYIDVVDVDSSLKEISEEYFLQDQLSEKIKFYSQSSRYFITNSIKNNKTYDAVVIDVYVWKSLAAQTLTYDFFKDVQTIWKDIYINIIMDKKMESDFSDNLLYTINEAFWNLYFKNVSINQKEYYKTNFIITNKEIEWYTEYIKGQKFDIYYDNKNSIENDLFKMNSKIYTK